MANPRAMSVALSQGSRQELRQPDMVWQAFNKLQLPGPDKDFIRQSLWAKLPVSTRLHVIFPDIPPWCPFDFCLEDHPHRLKSCTFMHLPMQILRSSLPLPEENGRPVEFSRLCTDAVLLSLKTPQGIFMWKLVRTMWLYRCGVMFRGEAISQPRFLGLWHEALKWWTREEVCCVPNVLLHTVMQGIKLWLQHSSFSGFSTPSFPGSLRLVQWKRRKISTPPHRVALGPQHQDPGQGLQNVRHVYTDGSFSTEKNGRGFAGCGFCVEEDPVFDSAFPLEGELQTINRAELFAVIRAAESLPQVWSIVFISDSKYVVGGVERLWANQGQGGRRTEMLVNGGLKY